VAIAKLQGNQAMTTLTVTARGQVTFRKDILRHLGIQPGEKIELDLLPDGRYDQQLLRTAGATDKESGHHSRDQRGNSASLGWQGMKITVDINVLVRSCVCDDPAIGLAGKLLCH
jgi:bifunctional DNA-binding transcriptional regulator/antitoxin component of YhaV-PrlF toxin-antitoxin module